MHALEEAWRVLVPHGIMVDLRPDCVENPLELVFDGGLQPVAVLDSSSSRPADLAADQAFESAVHAGLFKPCKSEYFFLAFYWNSLADMLVDMKESWWNDVVLPKNVVRRAARLYKKHPAPARLRMSIRSKLVVYEKDDGMKIKSVRIVE